MSDIIISEDGQRGAVEVKDGLFQAYVSKQNGEMVKYNLIMGGKKAMRHYLDHGGSDFDDPRR